MSKQYSDHDRPMDDAVLHYVLKRHDPVTSPTHASLASLEADIFAQIDSLTRNPVPVDNRMPIWMLPQGWTARAAALVAVLVIASGFVIGQISFGEADTSASIGAPSLLAFADEPALQSIPITDASWGDTNEDAQ